MTKKLFWLLILSVALAGCASEPYEDQGDPDPCEIYDCDGMATEAKLEELDKMGDQALDEYYKEQDRMEQEGLADYRADVRRHGCEAALPYRGPFDPSGVDRDCDDFSTQAEAQEFFCVAGGPTSDPHWLDEDQDGIACEWNP